MPIPVRTRIPRGRANQEAVKATPNESQESDTAPPWLPGAGHDALVSQQACGPIIPPTDEGSILPPGPSRRWNGSHLCGAANWA
jgi:hypothetical protein